MQQDLATLSEIFRFLDRDNDGILSHEDLQSSLGALNVSVGDFDKDPTGYDLPMFLATINSHLSALRPISASAKHAFQTIVVHNFSQPDTLIPMEKLHSLLLDHSEEGAAFSKEDWSNFIYLSGAVSATLPDPNNANRSLLDYEKLVGYFS
ncbi:hypothetical protein MDAP_002514 [Mitosporidium daphniae]|uniref:EF-hand domain-containing protein n=1 Tax=Mitosporidium daphniae TaxID=1485682 RepID=A0A098VNE2_9MICR|nr:uncharacterized protein DI09_6p490 [Mitosporidium daphniae]KGG50465.1 hypothetical protein DI09_6p490 [Mitosporidium daphniae]|eukprot:XP_013236892.1 uncharacterized protein DI09_6p490 [Mitosporidium daphniae]